MHELASKALFATSMQHVNAELCAARGWMLHTVEYPVVDVAFCAPGRTTLRLLVRAEDWNGQPPSIELQAADGTPLTKAPVAPGAQFHQGPHPSTGKPFVCMRGSREYHTHSSHLTDLWSNYRELPEYTLSSIITQVWNSKVPKAA